MDFDKQLEDIGWPTDFGEKLKIGNKKSNVGIVTLWTYKEIVYKNLDPNSYAIIGNFYDRQNGLEPLIRNCLANPYLQYLLIVGNDMAKSKEILINFFQKGIADGKVIQTETKIPKEIPLLDIEELRKNVRLIDLTGKIKNLDDSREYANAINETIATLPKLAPYNIPKTYEKPKLNMEKYPSEPAGFLLRGKTIGETWLKILRTLNDYGAETKMYTTDSGKVKECINLVAVVEEEDPDKPKMEPYFRFNEHYLKSYYDEICTNKIPEGTTYTYGSRFRGWVGKDGKKIDQIADMIEYLKKDIYRKSAIAQTWIVEDELTRRYVKNSTCPAPPCIILVQANVQKGVLHFCTYIRSNDMFRAWPLNAFGLRKLQKIIAFELGVDFGTLTTISCSAHVYQDNWGEIKELLDKYAKFTNCFFDPRGYYIIKTLQGKIIAEHYSPDSQLLKKYEGKLAREISDAINSTQHPVDSYHSAYLGMELMKAENAIKFGVEYVQDKLLIQS